MWARTPLAASSNKVMRMVSLTSARSIRSHRQVELEQAFGDQERHHHLRQRRTFLVGHVEGNAGPETVDEAIGNLGRDDLILQAMGADRLGVSLAHRLGEGGEKFVLHRRVVGQLQAFGSLLQRNLGHRQHNRQLGPGEAPVFLRPAKQLLAIGKSLNPPVEPAAGFEQLDRPHLARKRA